MHGYVRLASPLITMVLLAGTAATTMAQDDGLAGLVLEEVEPGVVRIVSDGAGHDLDEKHPSYRYDMDGVFVAPDGTVWLTTSYRETDNDANPPGALIWALGQSETPRYPADRFCYTRGSGVICWDPVTDTDTLYLAGTSLNAVVPAPDGTYWAVGADGAENGGLYRITPE